AARTCLRRARSATSSSSQRAWPPWSRWTSSRPASRSTPPPRSGRSTTAIRRSSGAFSGPPRATGCPSSCSSPCSSSGRRGSAPSERSAAAWGRQSRWPSSGGEQRAAFGRIVSSLIVVTLLVLAFGLGTGHDFTTFGIIPTSLVLTLVLDGLLRASYDAISSEALHVLGVRRRAIVVGEGDHLDHLLRTLGSVRGGIEYDFLGGVTGAADPALPLPQLGELDDLRAGLGEAPGRQPI